MELTCKFVKKGQQDVMLGDFKVGDAMKRGDGVWLIRAGIADERFITQSSCGLTDALNKLNFRYKNPALFQTGPASPEKLKAFLNNKIATKTALDERRAELVAEIDEQIAETNVVIEHVTQEIIDVTWPEIGDLEIGTHDCEKSILDVCVYDMMEDPSRDECLVCGEPDERK